MKDVLKSIGAQAQSPAAIATLRKSHKFAVCVDFF
jgi:hypothetical protein